MAAGDADPAVMRRYDAAQREFDRAGGYGWRVAARERGPRPRLLARGSRPAAAELLGRRADPRVADPRAGRASPTCCCSTSRPTTSTPTRSSGSRSTSTASTPPSCSCRTTAGSSSRWRPACSRIDRGQGRFEKGTYSHFRKVEAERLAAPGRRVRAPAGRARPPPAVRRPLPVRHQVAPGAVASSRRWRGSSGSRRSRAQKSLRFQFPAAAAQRPGGARRRGPHRRRRRADADHGRVVCDRARPAGRADRAATAPARPP